MPSEHELLTQEIGRLSTAAAFVEFLAKIILFALIDREDTQIGEVLVGGERLSDQLRRIIQVAPLRLNDRPELLRRVSDWASAAQRLLEDRNRLLHGVVVQKEMHTFYTFGYRRRGYSEGPVSVNEVGGLAFAMEQCSVEGMKLSNELSPSSG